MTATITPTASSVAVPKSELARALRAAAAVKAQHLHVDLTGDVAVATGYTSQVAVRARLDAPIIDGGGEGYVKRSLFAGMLAYLEPETSVRFEGETMHLDAPGTSLEINASRVTPPMPKGMTNLQRYAWVQEHRGEAGTFSHDFTPGESVATFEAPTLVEILRRALPSASRDETRPVLVAVALYPKSACAATTDSYRLAIVRYDDGPSEPTEEPILLHVEAAVALRKLLARKLGKVTIGQTETHYLVEFEDTTWSILRLPPPTEHNGQTTGRYPSWWKLLPADKTVTTIKVDRDDLLTASRAATALAQHGQPLRLNVGPDVTVKLASPDAGAMTRRLTSATADGKDIEIGLNPEFLADICQIAPVERLTLTLISPLRPLLVTAARDQYLLMPVRLNV